MLKILFLAYVGRILLENQSYGFDWFWWSSFSTKEYSHYSLPDIVVDDS